MRVCVVREWPRPWCQLDGISLELQATDADDVSEEAMREHVASVLTRS